MGGGGRAAVHTLVELKEERTHPPGDETIQAGTAGPAPLNPCGTIVPAPGDAWYRQNRNSEGIVWRKQT